MSQYPFWSTRRPLCSVGGPCTIFSTKVSSKKIILLPKIRQNFWKNTSIVKYCMKTPGRCYCEYNRRPQPSPLQPSFLQLLSHTFPHKLVENEQRDNDTDAPHRMPRGLRDREFDSRNHSRIYKWHYCDRAAKARSGSFNNVYLPCGVPSKLRYGVHCLQRRYSTLNTEETTMHTTWPWCIRLVNKYLLRSQQPWPHLHTSTFLWQAVTARRPMAPCAQ